MHFELVGGAGHAAALVDDLSTRWRDRELPHVPRDAHRGGRGAICRRDNIGSLRLGQSEHRRTGAAETGTEGTCSPCGGDQDLEMWKESRPVRLMEAVVHAGRDQAGVTGMQPEDQTPGGGHVKGCIGVGDRRWQCRASRTRERGRLRNEDHGAKIEPAVPTLPLPAVPTAPTAKAE